MSKKNKKVVEQELVTTLKPEPSEVVVPAKTVFVMKREVTPAMAKAQELMNTAVREVLYGIISDEELLNIARRKVRQTSVLTEEENEALEEVHIEVKVWY